MRIGIGSDLHRLEPGLPLRLGGIEIDSDRGAVGHSDGDALLHAITDAVLGALSLGDIGSRFPDTDDKWKDADSFDLLRFAFEEMRARGYEIGNVDSVIHLQWPKLRPYIDDMCARIAEALDADPGDISVKAKTAEGLGEIGNGLAVRAEAIVILNNAKGS